MPRNIFVFGFAAAALAFGVACSEDPPKNPKNTLNDTSPMSSSGYTSSSSSTTSSSGSPYGTTSSSGYPTNYPTSTSCNATTTTGTCTDSEIRPYNDCVQSAC